MSVSTGKYKKLNTYFYDYHALKISLETSFIRLKCILEEIKVYEDIDPKCKELRSLRTLLVARERIIKLQQVQLQQMKKVLDGFPQNLKGVEYDVYYLSIVENKNVDEVSKELCFTSQYIREIRSKMIDKFINYKKPFEIKH